MTIAERRRAKIEEFIRPQLDAGEQITVIIGHAQTGPTPWLQGLFGVIFLFWVRFLALVLTDRRIILIKKSMLSGRAQSIAESHPRNEVRVLEYKAPTVWGKLALGYGGETVKLNVHRMDRDQLQQLVDALGGVTEAPVGPPPGS
jgi:hypothetical protein